MRACIALLIAATTIGCSDTLSKGNANDSSTVEDGQVHKDRGSPPPVRDGGSSKDSTKLPPQPSPSCEAASGGGKADVSKPRLLVTFKDRWHEGWLASPAVADLDGDGKKEVIAGRDELLIVWRHGGAVAWKQTTGGRIWASPVVADLLPGTAGLEVAVAAREKIYAFDSQGKALAGFPVSFRDELRSIAAGDVDGDGKLELVVVTTTPLEKGGRKDIIMAVDGAGNRLSGFPPNTTGSSGCDDTCYVTGGYDQNLALGDLDGDDALEIFATQDNAYLSLHDGKGRALDVATIFVDRKKWPGIRFMLDYDLCKQGLPDNPAVDEQAHFTNSAPAIADIDGDGQAELIVLGSVQNASQKDRKRGVVLFVLNKDGSRPGPWASPFVAKDYLAGLWDFDGTNVVAATNQVTVADVDPGAEGKELLFAGFDGHIHCVSADKRLLWSRRYTDSARVLTGGVLAADLSSDGRPEVVFASYSPDDGQSQLFILDNRGQPLHKLALPKRGAMAVPTIADMDGNGTLEIVVSLKDGEDKVRQVMAYTVDGSADNCLLWPTGRGNLLRNGYVR